MNIALIQSALTWESPEVNLHYFNNTINNISENVDLIVLPEMFTTGFTMQPEKVAENLDGSTTNWMIKVAQTRNCAITGSFVVSENGAFFNRMLFVYPDGTYKHYDKRHLFTLAGEDKVYTQGNKTVTVEFRGYLFRLNICYDLRFPVFSRNDNEYDVLLYVANWPEKRIAAWDALLKARAIENMAYVVGVNRIGIDANEHLYVGHSQVVNYLGEYLLQPQEKEGFFIVNLDKNEMLISREKLGFLNDADHFTITI